MNRRGLRATHQRRKQFDPLPQCFGKYRFDCTAQMEALRERERREHRAQAIRIREDRADERALRPVQRSALMMMLDVRARVLDEAAVVNARGARGFASAASEAQIEMAHGVVVEFEPAFGERLHQVDAAARRIHLGARHRCRSGTPRGRARNGRSRTATRSQRRRARGLTGAAASSAIRALPRSIRD